MNPYAFPRSESRAPAFVGAIALHVGLFLLFTLVLKAPPILPMGEAVPINIISEAPAEARQAQAAPQTQDAATQTPVADAPPAPAQPAPPSPSPDEVAPAPAPAPAKPTPTPKPAPTPVAAKPAAAPKTPPAPAFSLAELQKSIDRAARQAPSRPSPAPRGPPRQATAPQATTGKGIALTAADQQALGALIKDYWRPNCDVDGGDSIVFDVKMTLGPDGHARAIDMGGLEKSSDAVKAAAAIRARSAAIQFAPLVPSNLYGQVFTITFNSKRACASS